MKKEKKEKLEEVAHNIQWVQEYIESVGEEHKEAYIEGLEYALKLIQETINE